MKKNWIQKYVGGWVLLLSILSTGCSAQNEAQQGWKDYNAIVKRIIPPEFPDHDFSILNYGAKADGATDCLPAIKAAIRQVPQVVDAGGASGTPVYVGWTDGLSATTETGKPRHT